MISPRHHVKLPFLAVAGHALIANCNTHLFFQAKEALKHPYFEDPAMAEVDQLENPDVRARD